MASSLIVKSLIWLGGFSTVGYLLLVATSQSDAEVKEIKEKFDKGKLTKTEQFSNVLQTATLSNKPLYRMTKEEIEESIKNKK